MFKSIRVLMLSALAFAMLSVSGFVMPSQQEAQAQGREANWRAVANIRQSRQTTIKWKWLAEEMAKRTNGRFSMSLTMFPELGLTGSEIIRLLKVNMLDIGEVVTGYVSGEVPIVEGAQMVGVYTDLNQAKKAYEGWMKEVILPNGAKMGGKPLGSFAYASMFLWTKFPVNKLSDLKGKKIRIFAKAQADYLKALGAEPVSIPLAEVYPSLERGVVDGLITGPDVANRFKLHEVLGYGTDLLLGPGAGYMIASQRAWDKLPKDIRAKFEALLPEMQKINWDVAFQENKEHIAAVKKNGIKLTIPAKPEWVPQLKKIAQDVVIPAWTARAGAPGVAAFNKVIAPIVGFKAK